MLFMCCDTETMHEPLSHLLKFGLDSKSTNHEKMDLFVAMYEFFFYYLQLQNV